MHRQTHRLLVQSFSLLNALFLAFQPLFAVPLVLSTPVAVQAETEVSAEAVDLSFNQSSHEFSLRVKTDRSLPYVLTYVDESQDPVIEQAATGDLEEIESGVYGDTIYVGTCSGEVCTPSVVNSGVLQIGGQLKMEYRLVNGQVVFQNLASESALETNNRVCLTETDERLTAGETLWTIDQADQSAETRSNVKLGVAYQFPLDPAVSVTFTCLPKDESARFPIKIQQVLVSDLALPDTVKTDSKYAYDITTEMENGTFEYELTLPKEEESDASVVYIEKSVEEAKQTVNPEEVKKIDSADVLQVASEIKVVKLDHFTIIIPVYILNPNFPNDPSTTDDDSWQCFSDRDGPNDEPGQKDLTQLCQDLNSVNPMKITWNWDEIEMSGNNTADACALFDTNNDSFANYALCVTWNKTRQQLSSSPNLYTCNNTKSDRCAGAAVQTIAHGSNCALDLDTSGPFLTGANHPNDTVAYCEINLNDVGGVLKARPLDVCSYPSTQPNSDPSDCVLMSDTKANLILTKNVVPDNANTNWIFTLTGTSTTSVNLQGDSTSLVQPVPAGTYSITETAGSNTNLGEYNTTWSCTITGKTTTTKTGTGVTASGLSVQTGDILDCTFTNTIKSGTLTVIKKVTNDSGGSAVASDFSIHVKDSSANDVTNSPAAGSTTGQTYTLLPGIYNVSEAPAAGYTASYSPSCQNVAIEVGDAKTCTVTNDDIDYLPIIEATKSANLKSVPENGAEVTFTFSITNNSEVDPVTITSLADNEFGVLAGDDDCKVGTILAAGATCTFDVTKTITGDANTTHKNVFTAEAKDNEGNKTSDTDDETVTFTDVRPSVTLDKTVDVTSLAEPGGAFTFTLTITNTAQEDVVITKLSDDNALSKECTDLIETTLAAGTSASCSYVVTHTEAGSYDNTASVTVEDNEKNEVSASDNQTVTVTDVAPEVEVVKTADPGKVPETGGDVTFTFVVSNKGVESVTLNSLVDDVFGNLNGQGNCVTPQTIAVGGNYTCKLTKTLSADDLKDHTNVVTATVTDNEGNAATDTDDETVTFTDVKPSIEVTKTASTSSVNEPGADVTFTFTVKNTSVEPVTITSLVDDKFGELTGDDDCKVDTVLGVDEECSFDYKANISGDASGSDHTNTFTATVVDNDGSEASGEDSETVGFDDVKPSIEVTKTADPTVVTTDTAEVTFTFLVTNNSLESGTILSLEDSVFGTLAGDGDCQVGTVLAGGASCTFEYTNEISGEANSTHSNVFTAVVGDNDQNQDSAEDDESVFFDFNSNLYISKTNSAWPNDQQIGDEVTYTIKVMAVGGAVTGVRVFDLPPLPFTYVPGSYTAESTKRGDLKGTTTPEPVYSSPGVWQLGDLVKDEIVTLTYKAKVGSTDPGIYPDMVWAVGTSAQAQARELATDDLVAVSDPAQNRNIGGVTFDGNQGHFGQTNFAGTQVAVVVDQTPSADHQVAVKIEEKGSVLGATTLPATGGRFWVSLVAVLTVLIGGVMIYLGRKHKSSALVVALMLGLGLMIAPSAQALTAIRIEQPYNNSSELNQDATTNQRDMKIDFVVMNTDNKSVAAQCQQSKDGGAWSDITTKYTIKAGGNSGYCEAKNLDNKSNYDFRVRVSGDGADQYSSTVRVGLDTDGPGTPINYGKSAGNNCEDVIKFRTADDNQTVRVDVYRSDNAEKFTASKDTRASQISIGPKTDYSLTTSKPDCQKTYYYVVRAFDANGNGSGLVGDEIITKVVVEGEAGQTQTVTVGAVPVGSTAGGSTINPLTGQSEGVGTGRTSTTTGATGEEGQVAEETEGQVLEGSSLGETEEEGTDGQVLGEQTSGGFFGWLASLWQSFISWLKSLFGLN